LTTCFASYRLPDRRRDGNANRLENLAAGQWGETRLAVYLKDGQVMRASRSSARGYPEDPARWDDLVEKYTDCAENVFTRSQIDETIAMIHDLEHLSNVRDLMVALQTQK
jgi:2-methylcitrate dehydratase PrpD